MIGGVQKLILPELSYKIIGALFDVCNELGTGLPEKNYYRAIKQALEQKGLLVKTQVAIPVQFRGIKIGSSFLDFLIENKVVLEFKIGSRFKKKDFEQIKAYLKLANKPLGILARISDEGVTFHRVLPPFDS